MYFFRCIISFKHVLLIFLITSSIFSTQAQSIGDFKSVTDGEWETLSTWKTYDGTSWVTATTYPGQIGGNYAVNIIAGTTVSISSAGISTQPMGTFTINGTLKLTGDNAVVEYFLNTTHVIITPNLTPNASIEFNSKSTFAIPTDGIIEVKDGGLNGSCNNNQEIKIGSLRFATCQGAPGYVFTFSELMTAGGTLNAIEGTPPATCLGEELPLTGGYTGAIGSPVTYSWTSTGPAALTFSPSNTSQNPTVTPSVPGLYTISLTVSTLKGTMLYSNTENSTLIIAPTISETNVAICEGESYLFNGTIYNTAGLHTFTTPSLITTCDSTAILNLTIIENPNPFIKDSICEGETYVHNGISYNTEGDYVINGGGVCLNTTLSLKVIKPTSYEYNDTICEGESYSFNGGSYVVSGTYTSHLINKAGCDSTITLNLTVNTIPTVTNTSLTQTICSGTSTTAVPLTSNVVSTSFEWTASTSSAITGFTTSGTDTIPAETLTNPSNTTPGTVTYVISPKANGCTGPNIYYEVTVNPAPIITDIYHQ